MWQSFVCAEVRGAKQKAPTGFFLHGYGRYVCREAQVTLDEFEESDERIRARTKEANPPRPNRQNKQAHPNSPPKETETELAHIRLKCEKKVKIQRSNTEVRRGNEFKILAALSTRCPSSNSFLPHG